MNRARAVGWGVIGGAVLLGGAWWTYQRQVRAPERALRSEIQSLTDRIQRADRLSLERGRRVKQLDGLVDLAIGRESEEVVHRLRVQLADLAEQLGLSDVSIGTRALGGVKNPGAGSSGASELRAAEIRDRADYGVVRGTISATGKLGGALSLLAALDGRSLLWRVESVNLTPTRDRSGVELVVELETLHMPDLDRGEPACVPEPGARQSVIVENLSRSGLFAPAPEPVVETPSRPSARPVKPSPAPRPEEIVQNWILAGLVEGASGTELWISMRNSGAMKRLALGEVFLGLRFTQYRDGRALLEDGGQRYWLSVGDSLGNRESPAGAG